MEGKDKENLRRDGYQKKHRRCNRRSRNKNNLRENEYSKLGK